MKDIKIGLALGEGGAKGLTQIGVLQVFQDEGIHIDQLAGTSIGAVVGAAYAETLDAYEIQKRFQDLLQSDIYLNSGINRLVRHKHGKATFWNQITSNFMERLAINLACSRTGLYRSERFMQALSIVIKAKDFSQCRIPFIAVATDLYKGKEVPLCAGSLVQAVAASSSIPGYFQPLYCNGRIYCDGAVCCPVPVKYAVCSGAHLIIGIATPELPEEGRSLENAIDIMIRAEEINLYYLSRLLMSKADLGIYPPTGDVSWNEFHRLDEMVKLGRRTAQKALPHIHDKIHSKSSRWHRALDKFK